MPALRRRTPGLPRPHAILLSATGLKTATHSGALSDQKVGIIKATELNDLTGTLTKEQVAGDFRGGTSRMGEAWDANQKIVEIVAEVARRHDATNAQVALAWLLHRAAQMGVSAVPIPGSRKPERALENLGAVDLRLDADDMTQLDSIRSLVEGSRNIVNNPTWISSGRE
ncbi:Aldo/keto reductase family protein [Brevibacterium aurantiacum]|uniref:Aldo/keto reductase family protein n=1 Tax=Brevibacterium aurantiacum TaxID=273384 RepID=A0A2H1KI17_BREAU|nr:Aldo/keto reductase family protein [Brevibacterium aurantiacum]SMY02512.1 Aldo/keto reductase family protein [Brevibacterium aurantiacum]